MPPESSAGYFASTLSSRSRIFSFSITRWRISAFDSFVCSTSGKATLSSTLIESSSAAYWYTTPNFWRTRLSSRAPIGTISSPSMKMLPLVGFSRATTSRKSVVFPAPEPPTTHVVWPRRQTRSSPRRISASPNRLRSPVMTTMSSAPSGRGGRLGGVLAASLGLFGSLGMRSIPRVAAASRRRAARFAVGLALP